MSGRKPVSNPGINFQCGELSTYKFEKLNGQERPKVDHGMSSFESIFGESMIRSGHNVTVIDEHFKLRSLGPNYFCESTNTNQTIPVKNYMAVHLYEYQLYEYNHPRIPVA